MKEILRYCKYRDRSGTYNYPLLATLKKKRSEKFGL